MDGLQVTETQIASFGKCLVAGASLIVLAFAGAVGAQEQTGDVPVSAADPADAVDLDTLPIPPAPADADLPEVPTIISREELRAAVPELDARNDPALDEPLETIAEFEQRLADEGFVGQDQAGEKEGAESLADGVLSAPLTPADDAAPLDVPALADGDPVEEIGDAPVRDAELVAPLEPIGSFEVEPVQFAEDVNASETQTIAYDVRLTGLEEVDDLSDANLRDMFNDLSVLEDGDGKAQNIAQISARLEQDGELISNILASQGWFNAFVTTRIDRGEQDGGQALAAVIEVQPNQRYDFSAIDVQAGPTQPADLVRDNLALEVGAPIIAARVLAAEARVAVALPRNGYPFAQVGARDILLDRDTADGVYTLPVETGPRSVFGGIETAGDLAFDADHVATLARFERGEVYDSDLVDDLRQALVATGLFNTVTVVPQQTGEEAGGGTQYASLLVTQDEGPPRTIAGSGGYGTGQGVRVEATWTHRNLFPPEGALIVGAVAGTKEQGAGVTFRRSNAGRRDRAFQIVGEALHSDYDAFEAYTGRLSARVSYDSTSIWQKRFTYAYGAQLLGTNEQDFDRVAGERVRRTFFIAGLVGQLGFDTTDSLLDPTDGFRVTALVEPEGSLQDGFRGYVRTRLDGSAYRSFGSSFVLAGRIAAGSIQGIDRFALAPSRRFYAGGGGSVRGFGYQELGPKVLEPNPNFDPEDPDDEDDPLRVRPIGGRSFNEAAAEVRYRFGNYGIVAFVDAGQVYEKSLPDASDIRFGAGIGGRFYTNFGPLRLDVATPINRQEGESRFAVYVSIGQAF
ncbi:autotransporter assembly complex protein TamA [Croceicoccus esteveae]